MYVPSEPQTSLQQKGARGKNQPAARAPRLQDTYCTDFKTVLQDHFQGTGIGGSR